MVNFTVCKLLLQNPDFYKNQQHKNVESSLTPLFLSFSTFEPSANPIGSILPSDYVPLWPLPVLAQGTLLFILDFYLVLAVAPTSPFSAQHPEWFSEILSYPVILLFNAL